LAVLVAIGTSASVFVYDLYVTAVVAAVAIAGMGAGSAWQSLRGAAVLDHALERVTKAAGLVGVPVSTEAATATSEAAVGRLARLEAHR
jgi:hypothetical protein